MEYSVEVYSEYQTQEFDIVMREQMETFGVR